MRQVGSFNVACSVSNLSLSVGTKVAFFPLLPRRLSGNVKSNRGGEKYLLEPDGYYFPFSLPIHGTYDGYGSVEKIVKDENTKAIEQFFGISIEAFVDGIGDECPEEIVDEEKDTLYQHLSGMFVHQEIFEELVAYDLKEKHLANDYLTQDIAAFYDFEVVPQEEQFFKDTHYTLLMRKKGLPYDLEIGKYGAKLMHKRHQKEEKYDVFSVKQFAEAYEQITGESLDTTVWYQISQYDQQYSEFQEALRTYKPAPRNHEEMLARTTDEKQHKLLKQLMEMNEKLEGNNDFGYKINKLPFMQFFKEMDYFKALYAPFLSTNGLREPFKKCEAFYWSMYSCNRFFFPAMNGEQFGNPEASVMLLKKSLEIVEKVK